MDLDEAYELLESGNVDVPDIDAMQLPNGRRIEEVSAATLSWANEKISKGSVSLLGSLNARWDWTKPFSLLVDELWLPKIPETEISYRASTYAMQTFDGSHFQIVFIEVVLRNTGELLVCVAEWYAGSKLHVYIDPEDEKRFFGKEHGLLLMNHTYEIDWLTAWMITNFDRNFDRNLSSIEKSKPRPTMLSQLNGEPVEPYMYIRRVPLDSVPDGEKEAAAFMLDFFAEKDKIIDSFHETGSFFKNSGVKEVPEKIYKPRLASLLNFLGWATVSVLCILNYLVTSLVAGNWTGFITVISILGGFYGLMECAVNAFKISKGSAHGATAKK
nr:LOW QUALITY PROTEIN: 1-acyl-sn-glycerol-3-phosphate acyltransferase delta-like [Drosophila suzukii]